MPLQSSHTDVTIVRIVREGAYHHNNQTRFCAQGIYRNKNLTSFPSPMVQHGYILPIAPRPKHVDPLRHNQAIDVWTEHHSMKNRIQTAQG